MNFSGIGNSSIHIPNSANLSKFFCIILPVYGIIVLPIFVIYLKVYKLNKSRDEETAVFQIIDHFHEINKKLTFILWCFVTFEFLFYYYEHEFIALALLTIIAIPSLCVTEVNQFLLGLLAIQRFLIYFYPSTEKYLNFSKRTMKWILIIAYSISVLQTIFSTMINIINEPEDVPLAGVHEDDFSIIIIYNISTQLFLTVSALLYIPIVISISKLTNLASAKINKPQIFVALQLVVVVVKQMVFLALFWIFEAFEVIPVATQIEYSRSFDSKYLPIFLAIDYSKLIDVFLMPTIIQITYLLCNRRNVMALWRSLKPTCCKWNAVDPNVALNYMENMATTQQ